MSVGFRLDTTFRLTFTEARLDGFECHAVEQSLGDLLTLMEFHGTNRESVDPETLRRVAEIIAGVIVSWNLEDSEGNPVPVNTGTVLGLPHWMFTEILSGLFSTLDVPGPLDEPSPDTPPEEVSIPMTALPAPHPN